tara:strand:- start:1937 stop:2092 length:156 start_codon:yes stop_codon:yes gene_type:complete
MCGGSSCDNMVAGGIGLIKNAKTGLKLVFDNYFSCKLRDSLCNRLSQLIMI